MMPGAIFWVNSSILSVCVCLMFELVSAGMNEWYNRFNSDIKYRHGGLWQQCMGVIERTFCTPTTDVPGWLYASRLFIVVAVGITVSSILYMMVAMARRKLNLPIMILINTTKCVSFFIGILVYTIMGFPTNYSPGNTMYIAWLTWLFQSSTSLLWCYSYKQVCKLTKLEIYEAGLTG